MNSKKLPYQFYMPLTRLREYAVARAPLPPQNPLLYRAEHEIRDRAEGESELEANIATVSRVADLLANGALEPNLRHAHHRAKDAECKSRDGSDAGW